MQITNLTTMHSKLALIGLGLGLALGGCDRPEVTGPETHVAERAGPAAGEGMWETFTVPFGNPAPGR